MRIFPEDGPFVLSLKQNYSLIKFKELTSLMILNPEPNFLKTNVCPFFKVDPYSQCWASSNYL